MFGATALPRSTSPTCIEAITPARARLRHRLAAAPRTPLLRPASADIASMPLLPRTAAGLAGVRPGDLGFYYAPVRPGHQLTFKQWCIAAGQTLGRLVHPGSGGDARVMHAYIVLQVYPGSGRMRVADAAQEGRRRRGVGWSLYDFHAGATDSPGGLHLYYRFKDTRLANAVRARAEAWAARAAPNFSNTRAAMAPFRLWRLLGGGRQEIRHLMAYAPAAAAVPSRNGAGTYPLMCSNFVSSVCIPEIIALYCRDHGLPARVDAASLYALRVGSAGRVFYRDPRWMLPSTLQARLAASRAVGAVGAISAD